MTELFFRKTYKEFLDFVSSAQDELIILSPYIKLEPIKLLLGRINPRVRVVVVAKWKLSDLVFGSSDIEVFEYLKNLNHNFYINNKIHLKVIIKDKKEILLGSANITGSGLGLFEDSNIEAIAIDSLDEKYLPSVYSILRESLPLTRNLVDKISKELEIFRSIKEDQKKTIEKLEKLENSIFIRSRNNILVNDFPFTPSPESFLNNVETDNFNSAAIHDQKLFNLIDSEVTSELLKQAFLKSNAYLWQQEYMKSNVLFGKYSELLHGALVDDPRPYRKQVKELVANMFNWTKEYSDEFKIIEYSHTKSMIRI